VRDLEARLVYDLIAKEQHVYVYGAGGSLPFALAPQSALDFLAVAQELYRRQAATSTGAVS
jgi:hypothetical protein